MSEAWKKSLERIERSEERERRRRIRVNGVSLAAAWNARHALVRFAQDLEDGGYPLNAGYVRRFEYANVRPFLEEAW